MSAEKNKELVITRTQLAQLIMPALRAHLYTHGNLMPSAIVIQIPDKLTVKDSNYAKQEIPIRAESGDTN